MKKVVVVVVVVVVVWAVWQEIFLVWWKEENEVCTYSTCTCEFMYIVRMHTLYLSKTIPTFVQHLHICILHHPYCNVRRDTCMHTLL